METDEKRQIEEFLKGSPGNRIDALVVRVVRFKGWGGWADPEDIIQNTRIILLECFRNGKYRGDGLVAYVQQVAKVQCLLELRRHYQNEKYHQKFSKEAMQTPDPNPGPLGEVLNKRRKETALKVLKTLGKACRQLLILRFYKNLSYLEIGRKMEMTEGNARVSTFRCLEKTKEIRKKMEEGL
jgi:RNA polymerase sigma factor (sigma-70 family)